MTPVVSYEKTGSSPAAPMVHVGASNIMSAKFSVVTEGSPVLIHSNTIANAWAGYSAAPRRSNDSCWMIPLLMEPMVHTE